MCRAGTPSFTSRSTSASGVRRTAEAGITERFGIDVPVMVCYYREVVAVMQANPFAATGADPARLLVMFLDAAPKAATVRHGRRCAAPARRIQHRGARDLSVLSERLWTIEAHQQLLRLKLGVRCTGRNWRTVAKLAGSPTASS